MGFFFTLSCKIARKILFKSPDKLLVSTNNDPYTTYADGITDTSIMLHVVNGNKYKLQTISLDHVNNAEQIKSDPDTTIEIKADSFFIAPTYLSKACEATNACLAS